MAEDYVRPPLVAVEPPSRTAATWRFRLVMLLLLLAVAAGAVLLLYLIVGTGEGGTTVGLGASTAPVAANLH